MYFSKDRELENGAGLKVTETERKRRHMYI